MECAICQIRSAVGVCEESNMLICEECSIPCYGCGKRIASTKGHETKNGHIYCTPCFNDRAARHAARRQERDGVDQGEAPRPGLIPAQEEVEEEPEEIVVLGHWQAPPPWKWALWLGIVGIATMGMMIAFPSVRGIRLSADSYFSFGWGLALLPLIGLTWAAVGMLSKAYADDPDKNRIVYGAVLCVVALVMMFFAVQTPPVPDELLLLQQSRKESRTPEQLKEYRQQILNGQRTGATPAP